MMKMIISENIMILKILNMNNLIPIINTILQNRGKQLINNLNPNTNLRKDLGFDSLDLAELTVRIEAEYNVDIFEDGIVNTIEEIMNKLNR